MDQITYYIPSSLRLTILEIEIVIIIIIIIITTKFGIIVFYQ